MKKVLSIMLTFAMLLAFVPVGFAGADDAVAVVVDTVTAAPADTGVEVYIRMTAEPHWSNLEMSVNFDPSVLVYKGFRRNPALIEQSSSSQLTMFALNTESADNGNVGIYFTTADSYGGYVGYYPDGYDYFGVLTFDVAATATVGMSAVSAVIDYLTDFNTEAVSFTVTAGGVNVIACEHDWQITAHEDEDCENAGYTDYECSICHTTKHVNIPARGHHWNEIDRVEPTTDAEGSVTYECVWCGKTRTEILSILPPIEGVRVRLEKVEALPGSTNVDLRLFVDETPHWSGITVQLNFDPDVLTFKRFSQNPAFLEQAEEGATNAFMLNKENADSGELLVVFASTYTADGFEGYHSGGNGYLGILRVNIADNAPIGFHGITVMVEDLVTINNVQVPNEVVSGGVQVNCAHDWVEIEHVEPSCEADGYAIFECSKCGDLRRESLGDAIGHDWGEWEVTTPATCSAEGVETRVCSRDATHIETRAIAIDPDAHEWAEIGRVAATCSAEGTVLYVCVHDADHEKTEPLPIDSDAHDWGEWEITTPATCTEAGVETRICKLDASHIETRAVPIDPNAHDWGKWEVTTPATCSAEGVETRVCAHNDEHIDARAIPIDPDAHSWQETGRQDPTCSSEGWVDYVCAHDQSHNKREDININPDAHDWGEWETVTPATCVAEGVETRVCKLDALHTETRAIPIDSDAHEWGEWTVTRGQTFYMEGEETRHCLRDDNHIETRAIPKYYKGDFDFDGTITPADALSALRIAARLASPTELALAIMDIDRDGRISVGDALQILRRAAKIVTEEAWLASE